MADDGTKPAETARRLSTPPGDDDAKVVQEEEGGFKEFLWNSEKKEFLGRTGRSWFDIFLFYVIFFLSLYCFFMLSWYVSLLVIDPKEPYKHDKYSILAKNGPGLTIRPVPDRDTNGASSLILFRPGAKEGYKFWSNQLHTWMENIPKVTAKNVVDCVQNPPTKTHPKACVIDRTMYGPCSGSDRNFGYDIGEPCILLKLNRVYAWEADPVQGDYASRDRKSALPSALVDYIRPNPTIKDKGILIWCEGEHQHDKDSLGSITYYPGPYIDKMYFPYRRQHNFQSPFVMIKLHRPLAGALISIVCRAYGEKLEPNKDTKVAYAKFQVLVL